MKGSKVQTTISTVDPNTGEILSADLKDTKGVIKVLTPVVSGALKATGIERNVEDIKLADYGLPEGTNDLETFLQLFADSLQVERDANWRQGDVVSLAVKALGKKCTATFAGQARRSREWVHQLVRVSATFPKIYRFPDVPWYYYLKIYQRASALGESAIALLELALAEGWSERDIAKYKKPEDKVELKFKSICPACSSGITAVVDTDKIGKDVLCPICQTKLGVIEAK